MTLGALGFRLCAAGVNGEEGIALAAKHQPHVVILDQNMPKLCGLDSIPGILAAAPHAKIIMWSSEDGIETAARERGAHHFHPKGVNPSDMAETVLTLCRESQAEYRQEHAEQ